MYQNLYRVNTENGRCIIDIALNKYMEFFHEWDSTTFRKRDVHPELAEYLDLCSEDIPLNKKLEIHMNVQDSVQDSSKEYMILASFRNYYTFLHRVEKRDIRDALLRGLALAATSTAFIFAYFMLEQLIIPTRVWEKVLVEGLLIGGWIFMWEAIHTATFRISVNVKRRKEIARYLKSDIIFTYSVLKTL